MIDTYATKVQSIPERIIVVPYNKQVEINQWKTIYPYLRKSEGRYDENYDKKS